MRFSALFLIALVSLTTMIGSGCQRHVELPPPPAKPTSIWSNQDGQTVAKQLVDHLARSAWTSQFRDRNGRAVRIIAGEIGDVSGKLVDMTAFINDISTSMANAGEKISAAATAEQADYVIRGKIGSQASTENGQAVTYFTIDLGFYDSKTGEPVGEPFAKEHRVVGQ
ncbi:MAG: hypothetical protein AAB263_04115 [Planctomycetota bacterium]